VVWVILGIESLSDKPAFIRARMIGQPDAQALLLLLLVLLPLLMLAGSAYRWCDHGDDDVDED